MLDIRFARANNFVGRPIDGYEAPLCLLTPAAAEQLVQVNQAIRPRGLAVVVYDCYRPQRAVDHFVRWARDASDTRTKREYYPNVAKSELLGQGYIADRSSHSRGSTVDLTLVRAYYAKDIAFWQPLDMGTPYHFFDSRSHTDTPFINRVQRLNRLRLREVMEGHGFRNLPEKWWHFTLENEPYPDSYFDVVVD